ncbi:MAG TPA: hypothetical protein DD789_06720 [Firmicutes bacterium]|jgi:transcriptional regulator with XRE-family HTH domain|nr:hypothetical protein [Bacillota bacterium]
MSKLTAFKKFRQGLELTQQEMADKMGVKRVKLTKVELGYQPPSIGFIKAFKTAFPLLTAEEIQRIFFETNSSDAETTLSPTGTDN